MKILTADELSIVPAVRNTPNGKYGYLYWAQNVEPEIVACLQRQEPLINCTYCGEEHTTFGNLTWMLALIDTIENINSPDANLFWFNWIVNPGKLEPTTREFIDLLHRQSRLEIAIPYNAKSLHLHTDRKSVV